ncbi:ferredoxin [Actinoplanes sp. TBRC 11911]|uniref:ferredoxin n=1 Tax=Actinoplanes sp. TBRC 11911 TaxID=2729386 RepID=UPI001B7D5E1C|nr:ferredoxin [Actinoplanes sp. TBRC 11911]
MRLHIDRTACDGRGLCAELLPELLESDEWGFPMARGSSGVPEELTRAARRAVDRCPKLAFHLAPGS